MSKKLGLNIFAVELKERQVSQADFKEKHFKQGVHTKQLVNSICLKK